MCLKHNIETCTQTARPMFLLSLLQDDSVKMCQCPMIQFEKVNAASYYLFCLVGTPEAVVNYSLEGSLICLELDNEFMSEDKNHRAIANAVSNNPEDVEKRRGAQTKVRFMCVNWL